MRTFFKGTILLVIVAFLGECMEFFINMILARELGEEGMGLYMSILPSIFLVVILASLELPVSISKFVAEQEAKYHKSMLQHVVRFVIIFTTCFLILAFFILPHIPLFDTYHPLVRWVVIIIIPIVSFSSIARGYFMGVHAMGKIAISNFLRKIIQLLLLAYVFQLFHFDAKTALFIALTTLVASDLVVFIYLGLEYVANMSKLKRKPNETITGKVVRKSLLSVSLPTTFLRIFHAITHAVQPFLIKAALISAGLTTTVATEHFGLLAGVALSIGFFPAFIAHSLLIVLIPTVSKAYSQKDEFLLQSLLQKVIQLTFLYGIPAILIFYFFAEPLTSLFFESSLATRYLQLLWPYFLFHFFVIPMQAYLIGLGLVKDAFYHQVWSTTISFILMFSLGSIQQLQMEGIILGMNTGAVLVSIMHYSTICKKIGISLFMHKPIKKLS